MPPESYTIGCLLASFKHQYSSSILIQVVRQTYWNCMHGGWGQDENLYIDEYIIVSVDHLYGSSVHISMVLTSV